MNVLILNQTFHPDVAATAQHMWDLARHLVARGHTVSAVTSRTVYGSTERFSKAHEIIDGVRIHRVPQTAFGKKHNLGRMADFLSYYVSSLWQMDRIAPPDVILALTSPPMISVLGALLSRFRRTRAGKRIALVNHVMDLYPDAAIAMDVLPERGIVTGVMRGITKRTYDCCDAVLALGEDMRDLLLEQYVPSHRADRVHVVRPWASQHEIFPVDRLSNPLRSELGLGDAFVVLYAGNLGAAHDVTTLVDAIRAARSRPDLRFVFTGGGKGMNVLQEVATREAWTNLTFLPYQPRERLNDLLNLADVHLVSQSPRFTGIVVPSKLFGILAAGKPSVMVGPQDAESGRILLKHQAGFVTAPGKPDELIAALTRLKDDATLRESMGSRARAALTDHYDASIACAQIEQILLRVAPQSR